MVLVALAALRSGYLGSSDKYVDAAISFGT
jgi:hypothetical protein